MGTTEEVGKNNKIKLLLGALILIAIIVYVSRFRRQNKKINIWIVLGVMLMASAIIIAYLTFAPVLKSEIKYHGGKNKTVEEKIVPVDFNFQWLFPRLELMPSGRKCRSFDAKNYQLALSRGVAHAKGTSTPDKGSNTFICSFSG